MTSRLFDAASYNKTPLIHEADERFKKQLASADITREDFFLQLAPLFADNANAGRYAACLIHRHYSLVDGERIVANGNSIMPSTVVSPNIVPESWLLNGDEFEYRFTDDPASLPPPPSADFLDKFKAITDQYNIDTFGVCYAPDELKLAEERELKLAEERELKLAEECVYLEEAGEKDREQVVKVVRKKDLKSGTYAAVWTCKAGSGGKGGMEPVTNCNHRATGILFAYN